MSAGFINLPLSSGSAVTTWKDPVADAASLPLSDNTAGDARVTLDTNAIYIWGEDDAWHELSGGGSLPYNPANSPTFKFRATAAYTSTLTLSGANAVLQQAAEGPFALVGVPNGAAAPVYMPNLYNGLGGIRYNDNMNGGNDAMVYGTQALLNSTLPFTITTKVFFLGFHGSFPVMMTLNTEGSRFFMFLCNAGGYYDTVFSCFGWACGGANFGITPNTMYTITLTYNGNGIGTLANFALYVNGVAKTIQPLAPPGGPNLGNTLIGGDAANDSLFADLLETIIDESLLTGPELTAQWAYLTTLWGA